MISIFDSTSLRTTSTSQDALNDLATRWNWKNIVYDTDVSTNVKELWASDKICITLSTGNTPYLTVKHTNEVSQTTNSVFTRYHIVSTDNATALIALNTSSSSQYTLYICVAKTIDPNGLESGGIMMHPASSGTEYSFTDNITTATNVSYNTGNWNTDSQVNTVVVPIYSLTGDEYFKDIYFQFVKKSTDTGKVILNDQYYYFAGKIALAYTP